MTGMSIIDLTDPKNYVVKSQMGEEFIRTGMSKKIRIVCHKKSFFHYEINDF
jgi:hypothetical protein